MWGLLCLQDTICQCKQLRAFHVAFKVVSRAHTVSRQPMPEASGLLMELRAALPELAVLQWRELIPARCTPHTRHMSSALTAGIAAESPAGCGLRLLQAEQCSFASVPALPASLQVFWLCNGLSVRHPQPESLNKLLAPCAALRELYILQYRSFKPVPLNLSVLTTACPALQVLVLHYDTCYDEVKPYLQSSASWPAVHWLGRLASLLSLWRVCNHARTGGRFTWPGRDRAPRT